MTHHNGTQNARRLELEQPADAIADGVDEYRQQASEAHAAMIEAARPPFAPQQLARAQYDYHAAELALARRLHSRSLSSGSVAGF